MTRVNSYFLSVDAVEDFVASGGRFAIYRLRPDGTFIGSRYIVLGLMGKTQFWLMDTASTLKKMKIEGATAMLFDAGVREIEVHGIDGSTQAMAVIEKPPWSRNGK